MAHIPEDFTFQDYERDIISITNGVDNDVFLYSIKEYKQECYVFGDGAWVSITGENGVMETPFYEDSGYIAYVSEDKDISILEK